MRVFLTETAQQDVRDIVEYCDTANPHIADRFAEQLQDGLDLPAEHPQIGHVGYAGLRELGFPEFPYLLSYKAEKAAVYIIAILHTSRDRERALAARMADAGDGDEGKK